MWWNRIYNVRSTFWRFTYLLFNHVAIVSIFIFQESYAELFLDIVGFQLEYKEREADWGSALVASVAKSKRWSVLQILSRWRHWLKVWSPCVSGDGKNPYRIQGLKPQTFYHVRAKARNLAGLSDPSNVIYLQTNMAPNMASPAILAGGHLQGSPAGRLGEGGEMLSGNPLRNVLQGELLSGSSVSRASCRTVLILSAVMFGTISVCFR